MQLDAGWVFTIFVEEIWTSQVMRKLCDIHIIYIFHKTDILIFTNLLFEINSG